MSDLEFTGERYVPGLNWPQISYEHWHRYLYAAEVAAGQVVLDIASGEGYGSALLAQVAQRVVGVDADAKTVEFASRKYYRSNLEFRAGAAHAIPVHEEHAFDLVVCFETLEHMSHEHQLQFLREIKRVLKPQGTLLLSTPNKLLYSDDPGYTNEYHVKELYLSELDQLLRQVFTSVKLLGQKVYPVSYIWPLSAPAPSNSEHHLVFSEGRFRPVTADGKQPLYLLAACSDRDDLAARGSVLIDLSHRLTGALCEQIAATEQAGRDLRNELQARAAEAEAARHEVARLEEAMRARQQTIDGLLGEVTQSRDEAGRLAQTVQQRDVALEEAAAKALELHGQCDRAAAAGERLADEIGRRDARIQELESAVSERAAAALRSKQELESAVSECTAAALRSKQELESAVSECTAAALRSNQEIARRDALISRLEQMVDERDEVLRQSRRDIAARERSLDDLRARFEGLLQTHGELTGRLALSEPEVSRLQKALDDRSTWAYGMVETLMSMQARSTPRQPENAAGQRSLETSAWRPHQELEAELDRSREAAVQLEVAVADTRRELDLTREALEAEQKRRQKLERSVEESYRHLKRRIAESIDRVVPARATLLVISRGDEDLVRLNGRRAWHFPQTETAVYAGHHPPDSAAAIAHLEQLRAKGAQFLVLPATSRWWLDHYSQFAEHLTRRYRQIFEREDVGLVFDLRRARAVGPDWTVDLASAIEEFRNRTGREPAILDCVSGLDVASCLPHQTIMSVAPGTTSLPYLDATIDVVVCGAASPLTIEARRVAKTLFLSAALASGRGRPRSAATVLRSEWIGRDKVAAPSVSIIVPCHNGSKLTEACLAAVTTTLPSSFEGEVLVVDDASTDGTHAMLGRWKKRDKRVRVLRNSKNVGFLRSCNRAARAARGDMLVFLNNDTVPARGWLAALLRTFQEFPDAGAVGGKLVLPDGTLQEAGSVVFRDGSAANFGRGDTDPNRPLFNYVREVDYCSGALLATPRQRFHELGGFDARYSPAYYEDTDYCFKVRDKGYRVYYQPAATVTHHEGASCGRDVTRGVKRYQVINREKFLRRWKTVLDHQPERPLEENLQAWHLLAVRSVQGAQHGRNETSARLRLDAGVR